GDRQEALRPVRQLLPRLPADLRRLRHGAAVPAVGVPVLADRAARRGAGVQPVVVAPLAAPGAAAPAGGYRRAAGVPRPPAAGPVGPPSRRAEGGLVAAAGRVAGGAGFPRAGAPDLPGQRRWLGAVPRSRELQSASPAQPQPLAGSTAQPVAGKAGRGVVPRPACSAGEAA